MSEMHNKSDDNTSNSNLGLSGQFFSESTRNTVDWIMKCRPCSVKIKLKPGVTIEFSPAFEGIFLHSLLTATQKTTYNAYSRLTSGRMPLG